MSTANTEQKSFGQRFANRLFEVAKSNVEMHVSRADLAQFLDVAYEAGLEAAKAAIDAALAAQQSKGEA